MRKIADIVENMGQTVTRGYKAIETGAVSSYKAIENGVVTGYEKVSDKCVEILFAKEGEFVEEAKARLAANRKTKD